MASFLSRATQLSWSTLSGSCSVFGSFAGGSDSLANSDSPPGCDWNPMPGILTLQRLAVRSDAGAGSAATFQPFVGIPKVDTGPSVILGGGSQQQINDVSVSVAAPSVVGDLATTAIGYAASNSGDTLNSKTIFKYALASPYDNYNIIASGFADTDFFRFEATRYLALNSAISSATEANEQGQLSHAGTFQYFLAVVMFNVANNDSTITLGLRKGGATVISVTVTNSTTLKLARDIVTTAAVVPGDLLNFFASTGGTFDAGHRAKVYCSIGFLPS